jgi:hypothetical protein
MPTKNQERNRDAGNNSGSPSSGSNTMQRQQRQPEDFQAMAENVYQAVEDYSRTHPAAVATAIFFMGFYVGWKVKPW